MKNLIEVNKKNRLFTFIGITAISVLINVSPTGRNW